MAETVDEVFLNEVRITDRTANAGALGLMAFGMTTIILNLHNAGLFGMGSGIFAMGIFYGGLAQVIVGILEWKKSNTFGMAAFVSYGFFWIALVFILLMPTLGWTAALDKMSFVAFLTLWGIFS
ncbi:MAG: acetate uptake transporter, partial [Methanoregula sp.]|nr:acetate uptake transporter [Methanoregula sp.]